MRLYSFLILIMLVGVASADTTSFSMHPGDRRDFLLTGPDPTISVDQGIVRVISQIEVAPDTWLVTLECDPGSPVDCEGTISA